MIQLCFFAFYLFPRQRNFCKDTYASVECPIAGECAHTEYQAAGYHGGPYTDCLGYKARHGSHTA